MPGLLNDQEYKAQFFAGRGATAKYGPPPPTPDEVAPRGTKAWRDAFRAQDAWRGNQLKAGATAWDLGLRDEKELGRHFFTRMRMGEIDPRARGNWIRDANGAEGLWNRGTYRPNDDMFYSRGLPKGLTGPYKGMSLGSLSGMDPSASPGNPIFQPQGFQGGMAESPTEPGVTATGSYSPFPRGGKRRRMTLGEFAGG